MTQARKWQIFVSSSGSSEPAVNVVCRRTQKSEMRWWASKIVSLQGSSEYLIPLFATLTEAHKREDGTNHQDDVVLR